MLQTHILKSIKLRRVMLPLFLSPTRVIGEVPSEFQHVNYTLIIDKEKIIITDFLDKPQFVCSLNDLSKGIINSVCVDEKTKKYIPNEQNMAEFERLKWQ